MQFGSFTAPVPIMLSLPLSLIGVVLALNLTGGSTNLMSFIGVILAGEADPFFVEQEVIGLVGTAMESGGAGGARRQRDARAAVEAARAEICRDSTRSFTVREVALRVGVSPFHLCRLFRRETGITLHTYLVDLRLRRSLEWLSDMRTELSRVALEARFSSHSHYSAAFRRRLGTTPSKARSELSRISRELSNPVTAAGAA